MGIVATWNAIEAAMVKRGFKLADYDDVPQGGRFTMRIMEVPGNQEVRGTIASGVVRLSWNLEVVLYYELENNKRVERKIAEDAESVIAALYGVNLTNHHFLRAEIARGEMMARSIFHFDFQDQVTL